MGILTERICGASKLGEGCLMRSSRRQRRGWGQEGRSGGGGRKEREEIGGGNTDAACTAFGYSFCQHPAHCRTDCTQSPRLCAVSREMRAVIKLYNPTGLIYESYGPSRRGCGGGNTSGVLALSAALNQTSTAAMAVSSRQLRQERRLLWAWHCPPAGRLSATTVNTRGCSEIDEKS